MKKKNVIARKLFTVSFETTLPVLSTNYKHLGCVQSTTREKPFGINVCLWLTYTWKDTGLKFFFKNEGKAAMLESLKEGEKMKVVKKKMDF